jgi:glycosyltransferase involved in cell wall biosynthesis
MPHKKTGIWLNNKKPKMTKVVQLQYSTESAGSAGLRLHKAFLQANVDSCVITLMPDDIPAFSKMKYLGKLPALISRLDNKLQAYLTKKGIRKFGLFSYPILGTDVTGIEEVKRADYIYIHWALNGFLNFKSIRKLAKLNTPIIIFMHDMWSLTGGCHYSFDCEKYKTGCSSCQMFPSAKKNDLSARGFKKKLKLFSDSNNFFFVSPSKWLYDCAKQSLLTKDKPLFYIPNLLDTSVYKPFDKIIARQALNVDTNGLVLAFGAVSINSPYKGWSYLLEALTILKKDNSFKNITVLIFGSGYNKQIEDAIPFKTKFTGYLRDEYSTAMVYNAANVFIAPSLVEAFGYVIMESLCCGTPVVGFDAGGIPDIIKHKENGYIAKYKDANDVYNGIKFCLQNNLKGYINPNFNSDVTVKKHLELFKYISEKKIKDAI